MVDSAQARSIAPTNSSSTEAPSSRRHAVGRLVQAVPAALARLVSGPTPQVGTDRAGCGADSRH